VRKNGKKFKNEEIRRRARRIFFWGESWAAKLRKICGNFVGKKLGEKLGGRNFGEIS